MQDLDPLYVDIELPPGALLQKAAGPTAVPKPTPTSPAPSPRHPNDTQAIWYRGHAPAVALDDGGAITLWRAEAGLGTSARRAAPNDGAARLAPGGGIAYAARINGGFVVEAALVEPEQFCCAVRFGSLQGQARTLLTLNPPEGDNYLFLSEKDGMIEWRDDANTVEVSVPSPGPDVWVVAGYDRGRLSLAAAAPGAPLPPPQLSGAPSAALAAALAGVSDLFIGCRSHRKGILKTLGTSTVHDVLLWLDHAGTSAGDIERLTAACRYAETAGDPP